MLFNSPEFIFVFLPLALLGCVAAARLTGANGAVAVLVAASFIFYAYWRVDDLILLVVSIAFNYVVGQAIARMVDQGEAQAARRLLVAGIAFNLLLIAVFKYSGFFARSANSMLGLDLTVPQFELPLGISFFTFTQITFLADVYGRRTRETSPLRYALFVTFFPHLIAGPILHQRMMTPQFQQKTFGRPDLDQISAGLIFFVVGLFKKQLLADPMGSYANPVFDAAAAGSAVTPWEAWAGTLAYTMQIYFDFSGYSDMAVGLGLLFGVRLPVNFASPYKAESIVDFWRRWHITLSQFLRDYVYIPLGGNRDGRIMRYRNLLLTMLLGGLWHGANWTFVIWGGLHGLFICVNHAWQGLSVPHFGLPLWIRRSLSCGITFLSVVLAWVPFRADSLATTLRLWRIMTGFEGVPLPAPIASMFGIPAGSMFGNGWLERGDFWLLEIVGLNNHTVNGVAGTALLCALCFVLPNVQEVMRYDARPLTARSAVPRGNALAGSPIVAGGVIAIAFWLCVLSLGRPTHFLYFNF